MIEPPFTEAHEEFRARAREFVLGELRPHADEWEEAGWFPNEVFGALASRGWLGLKYEGDWVADAVLAEELARCGSGGVAAGIGAHIHIATPPIFRFGTPEQRARWLEPAVRGELIGALAITEPDAGSDVASIRTRAVAVDGGWLVSGAKTYITNGVRADFYVTAVRTGGDGHGGLSFLVLERGEGIAASALSKLGLARLRHRRDRLRRGLRPARAPARRARRRLQADHGQLPVGAAGDGARRGRRHARTLERAVVEPAGQAYRHRIADLATRAAAGTALTYHALRRYLDGGDAVREVTMAKLATQRANFELQDECLRLLGPDPELERAVRDARLGPIGGGTDEIMREILARTLTS